MQQAGPGSNLAHQQDSRDTCGLNHTAQLLSPCSGTICSRQGKADRVGSMPLCLKDTAPGGGCCSFCFPFLPHSDPQCQLEQKCRWTKGVNCLFVGHIPVRTTVSLIHLLVLKYEDGCQKAWQESCQCHELKVFGQLPFLIAINPLKEKPEQPPS